LPDFSVFPTEMNKLLRGFESPRGTYYDAFPLLVMSEQALSSLRTALPDSSIDVRRFRPSIVVDTDQVRVDSSQHPEFGWAGSKARIGSAQVEFTIACPRCIMVTRQVDDAGTTGPRRAASHRPRPRSECGGLRQDHDAWHDPNR
jgi:uncharacterized protein YcbX